MITGARPSPRDSRRTPECSTFWSADSVLEVTTLRFHDGGLGSGTDPRRTRSLWEFFESLLARPPTVLRISFPSGGLSHDTLVGLWQYFRELARDDASHRLPTGRARDELHREDIALARYMTYVRDDRLFVVGDVRGQLDINLLGLLLVCDYRIAERGSEIVKAANPLGAKAGAAAPFLLCSIAGPSRALPLLLDDAPLSARSALRHGIFHRLTPAESHERDTAAIATQLSAKGPAYLRALKNAVVTAAPPLRSYLERNDGAGFRRVPPAPKCRVCGYDLTGNLSGRCPECGQATVGANEGSP